MITSVGFIGVGSMGRTLALNVLREGFDLMVFDIVADRLIEFAAAGARIGKSAAEVAAHAEIIEIVVIDDAELQSAVLGPNGVLTGARPGSVIVIHSTVHPQTVRHLAARARLRDVDVIDAQVSGDASGVETKILCFMVGGDKAVLEKCRPVLAASGGNIFHIGELGQGAATKLAHQVLVIGMLASVAEAMSLAERVGIDPKVFERVLRSSAAQSYIAETWLGLFSQFDQKNVDTIRKSVIPGLNLAEELGLSLPLTTLAHQLAPAYILGPEAFIAHSKKVRHGRTETSDKK